MPKVGHPQTKSNQPSKYQPHKAKNNNNKNSYKGNIFILK